MQRIPGGLGRVAPPDFEHVLAHPFGGTPQARQNLEAIVETPQYVIQYNQGQLEACTGFSASWAASIFHGKLYEPIMLWKQARLTDALTDNNDLRQDEGSTVRGAMSVLRHLGHVPADAPNLPAENALLDEATLKALPWSKPDGIRSVSWATTVDHVREAVAKDGGRPVVFGINWYENFDTPVELDDEWWIGHGTNALGSLQGGHAICCTGVSDERQAIQLTNSWGVNYPKVWVPYELVERLLGEAGECGVPVAR